MTHYDEYEEAWNNEIDRRERESREAVEKILEDSRQGSNRGPIETRDLGDSLVIGSYDFEKEAFIGKIFLKGENPEDGPVGDYENRSYA